MSGLRVIGGVARGLRLKSVPGDSTRPITDRVKEALFNIIGADISAGNGGEKGGATFLDLFGGTGSVGIEALSRGAAFARFVELNRMAVATIHANLEHTGLDSKAEVIRMDSLAMLERLADRAFDYIYVAPPQYKGLWKKTLSILDTHTDWLSEDAWIITQIHPVEYEKLVLKNLVEFDQRHYGSTLLIFYRTAE